MSIWKVHWQYVFDDAPSLLFAIAAEAIAAFLRIAKVINVT